MAMDRPMFSPISKQLLSCLDTSEVHVAITCSTEIDVATRAVTEKARSLWVGRRARALA